MDTPTSGALTTSMTTSIRISCTYEITVLLRVGEVVRHSMACFASKPAPCCKPRFIARYVSSKNRRRACRVRSISKRQIPPRTANRQQRACLKSHRVINERRRKSGNAVISPEGRILPPRKVARRNISVAFPDTREPSFLYASGHVRSAFIVGNTSTHRFWPERAPLVCKNTKKHRFAYGNRVKSRRCAHTTYNGQNRLSTNRL